MRGVKEAKGEIVVMGDSDGTYDFNELGNLIAPFLNIGISVLKGGNVKCQMANVKTKACLADYSRGAPDIIIGSRLCGKIEKGAMPFLNRYLGTPVLNFFLRLFFGIHLSDSQSGFRAFRKEAIKRLNLKSGGMEFASEMLVSARQNNLLISEVPVTYRKRIGKSKLSPIRDAWRHVRFMLFFSPTYLFLIPGGTICLIGLIGLIRLSLGPMYIGRGYLDIHTMMVSSFVATLGFQIFFLGLFAKVYAYLYLNQRDKIIEWLLRQFTLERGLLVGGIIVFWGMMGFLGVLKVWIGGGFGELSAARPVLLAITMLSLGVQAIFGSFLFALLGSRWER
jgi:glycosyltransferase involved in cell wall biosynthesis